MIFKHTIKLCLTENFWSFDGRASRYEFWSFMLFLLVVQILLMLFTGTWQMKPLVGVLFETTYGFYLLRTAGTAIELLLIFPAISVTVRRLHDSGLSRWWYPGIILVAVAIGMVFKAGEIRGPLFTVVALTIIGLRKGSHGENRFGPAPEGHAQASAYEASGFAIGSEKLWIGLRPLTASVAVGIIVIFGLLDGAIAGLSRTDPNPFFDPNRQQVTLRDPGPDARWRTGDDAVWALSFPMSANVEPVLEYRWVSTITVEGIEKVKKTGFGYVPKVLQPPNPVYEKSTLKVLLSLPEFGDAAGRFEDQKATTLEISLPSQRRDYDGTPDWGTVPSLVSQFEKLTKFDCELEREIAPGVFKLRDMSTENARAADAAFRDRGPRFEIRRNCVNQNATHGARYAVVDENGSPMGMGTCEAYVNAAAFGICRFEFWLPQERIIQYRFSEKFLPLLREIDAFARTMLAEATVASASDNIKFPDSRR